MLNNQPMGLSEVQQTAFAPLVQLLEQELAGMGLHSPAARIQSLPEFTRYYLDVVQLLEAQVAGAAEHSPMSRGEVELMCRSTLSAVNLAEAIAICESFCAMLDPRAGRTGLREEGDSATFYLDSLRPATTTASSLVDITGLFAFQQLFQWLTGVELPLRQVGIGAIQRDDVIAFLKLFRAPVLAGGTRYTLVFDRSALELPVVRSQGDFAEFFAVFPCGVFEFTANSLPQQVAALLHAAIRQSEAVPGQAALAASLGIPLSTFRRHLAAAGTSFREIRERCLRDNAEQLLLRTELAIAEIAAQLGFSDASAFRRAFRQWLGVSPRAWRESTVAAQTAVLTR
ncbi:AraC family transcriptional regulator [Candidatus Litorirhabdus singularis]|nr:AraC family transcriptional regulator [Candidatus Litorirhabdus singularis]